MPMASGSGNSADAMLSGRAPMGMKGHEGSAVSWARAVIACDSDLHAGSSMQKTQGSYRCTACPAAPAGGKETHLL